MRSGPRHSTLRYAADDRPGISRAKRGRGFVYHLPGGGAVRSERTLNRIRRLAIPPAWTDVWIARHPNGHLQATGRDAKGRKQYRYHAAWTAERDAAKYDRLLDFAAVLPAIRRGVARDLSEPPLSRPRVLATVVALLQRTHIRVGNDEYARDNGSYGLTTMRNRHVQVRGSRVEFKFRGKSGISHAISVDDPDLARDVRRCQELPGQQLFAYRDEARRVRRVGSSDINRYLGALAGRDVTAKDFRTWWGTVAASVILRKAGVAATARARSRVIVSAIDEVAHQLGNTRAVCRRCYIHPRVLEAYDRDVLARPAPLGAKGLSADERALVALLERMEKVAADLPIARRARPRSITVRKVA